MRKLLIFLSAFILINSPLLHGQSKGFGFDLSSGIALPQSQLSLDTSLIRSGLQLGSGINYLGDKFGVELNTGYFENALSPHAFQSLKAIPAASGLTLSEDKWQSLYGALGPVLRLGGAKLDWQLSPKIGWLKGTAPKIKSLEKAIGQSQAVSLGGSRNASWQRFWSVGTQLQWHLSKRLGVQLKADFLAGTNGPEVNPQQLAAELEGLGVRKGIKDVQHLAMQIAQQKTNVLNLGAGITYHFGNKDNQDEKSEASCDNSYLMAPANGAIFLIEGELRPGFRWNNGTPKEVKYYHFQLFDGDQQVYDQKTEKNELPHGDPLEAIYKKGAQEEKTYSWQVTTYYSNCEPLVSERFYFKMSNRSGAFHDIFDLECDAPAFTDQGDLRITGKISFFNNLSASDPLIINSFSDVIIQDVSGTPLPGVALANITDCISGLPVPLPLSIAPGSTETYCFELVVPAGHTAIRSEAHGTINGLPQMSTDQDDLPSCSCTVCDNWRFSGKTSTLNYVTSGGNFFNAMVFQDIQISNAAPIKEVKAEIVYVEHVANDPQCYTCTKHENEMGLVSFHPTKPLVVITNGSWKNNKLGYKGPGDAYDTNNDNYVNQIIWKANDPVNGIDFSSSAHRFRIPINLPKPSSLKCCDHRYEVCVRYTFTDVNCVTCDYLVCYQMSPKQNSGGLGTGGLDPSTGVDLGGIGTIPNIPLPGTGDKGGN